MVARKSATGEMAALMLEVKLKSPKAIYIRLGGNIGYGWGTASDIGFDSTRIGGLIGGGELGYDFRLSGNVIVGVKAEFEGNGESGSLR